MFPALLLVVFVALPTDACRAPEVPKNGKFIAPQLTTTSPNQTSSYPTGATVVYTCDENFELLGPKDRHCRHDGIWHPRSLPFCLSDATGGLPAVLSSSSNASGEASLAVDGNKSTCVSTDVEDSPWLAVDLKDVLPITLVKLSIPDNPSAVHVIVRVGNSTTPYARNAVCSVFKGYPAGQYVYLLCSSVVSGRYVSIHLSGTASLSICEFMAYSETAGIQKSAKTITLAPFGHARTYTFMASDDVVGLCCAVISVLLIVCLFALLPCLKRKYSQRSSTVEAPAVESKTRDRFLSGRTVTLERLL